MSTHYRPTNSSPHARTIDTSVAPQAGMPGAQPQNPYGQDPLSKLKGMLGGGGTGGPIRWDTVGTSRYEDDGFRALKGATSVEEELNQEYILKYAEVSNHFLITLCRRQGGMYQEYKNVLEAFRHSKSNGGLGPVCQIRSAFVDTLNRHPEFIQGIAIAATPVFGQILIDMSKMSQSGNLPESDYRRATQMASTMVLTMEFISWLVRSQEGREKANYLTPEIKRIVGDLEKFKDTFTKACTTFGVPNPYASLVFENTTPMRADVSMIAEAERALAGMTTFGGNAFQTTQGDVKDLYEQIYRSAQRYNGRVHTAQPVQTDSYMTTPEWETKPVDYSKINVENKNQFDYHKLFRYMGKDNWYLIPESDWKNVKHAFKRHPDQPEQEDSVIYGYFRVVNIDLENDTGWFSTVVPSKGMDMATAFTDPSKLLPELEGVDGSSLTQVVQVAAADVLGKGKSTSISPAVCEKLEGIPVITLNEEVSNQMSGQILSAITATNKALTVNLKTVNATSFNTVIWDVFKCDSAEDRKLLLENVPQLFKDTKNDDASFFMQVKRMVNFFDSAEVDQELAEYVDSRLTQIVNEWLINSLGYHNNPDHHNYLAVESIFEDYSELDNIFKTTDEEAFRCFNAPASPSNFLTEQMKLFVSKSERNKEADSDSIVEKVQKGLGLVTERPIHFTVINRRVAPSGLEQGNEPIVIRRSKFPEFFHLVEEGFLPSMGKGAEIKVVDKIIRFEQDDSMWLFSYSSLDVNVATLRRVTTRRSLLVMDLV